MDVLESREERDEANLYEWQIERFRELGYQRHQAEILFLAHVDWHELRRLLDRDCGREAALRILT